MTATGFLAMSRRFGFDSENYHHLTIQDTIDTTGQAFLGLTLGCARCHDHKYDPVSARDYYALYGIFDSTRYPFAGSEQKPNMRSMASLRPRAEAEALRDSIGRLAGQSRARKRDQSRPRIATLDDIDGDFELQKPSAGGSLGCLVTPWLFEGRPDVIADAQSPFTNLTHPAGEVGVRFPGDAADHRVWQRHLAGPDRQHDPVAPQSRLSPPGRPGGDRVPTDSSSVMGAGVLPAIEVFIGSSDILSSDGDSTEIDPAAPPGDVVQPPAYPRPRAEDVLGHHRCAGGLTSFADRSFAIGWDGTIDTDPDRWPGSGRGHPAGARRRQYRGPGGSDPPGSIHRRDRRSGRRSCAGPCGPDRPIAPASWLTAWRKVRRMTCGFRNAASRRSRARWSRAGSSKSSAATPLRRGDEGSGRLELRRLAHPSRESPDRPGHGQPDLGRTLRQRPGGHRERFRPAGPAAHAPRPARRPGRAGSWPAAGRSRRCTG